MLRHPLALTGALALSVLAGCPDCGGPQPDAGLPSPDDAGTPVDDAGPQPIDDAGPPPDDAGAPLDDAGLVLDDAGAPLDDAGLVLDDAGPQLDDGGAPLDDAGPQPDDAGAPFDDAGVPPPVDAGPPPVDAGPPPVDAGAPLVDAGPPPGGPGPLLPNALDPTVPTRPADALAFLYTGPAPVQVDADPAVFDEVRLAHVAGRVTDPTGAPLPGARVEVRARPALGWTESRADGRFDLAVNGGATLTFLVTADGHLPVLRTAAVPFAGTAALDDVVLTPLDPQVTVIDLTAPTMQTAAGTAQTDVDGTRTARVAFPAGTSAELVLPDGTRVPTSTLSVRATEFTVGARGKQAMPAALPPTSGYTYAVEVSVDEALAAGATEVALSQPVPVTVDNFLGFPIGGDVPVGYLDRAAGAWVPMDDGRVIEVLSLTDGLADLDVDGSGTPAGAAALTALGIDDAERAVLGASYAPGASLWRFLTDHFTPFDCNWPERWPPVPDVDRPRRRGDPGGPSREQCGSRIEVEEGVLGDAIDLVGAPFDLHYNSYAQAGRADRRSLSVPVSDDDVPPRLSRISVELEVAGRRITEDIAPAPNAVAEITWDGLDAFGRRPLAGQSARVKVRYVYPTGYVPPADVERAFGVPGIGTSLEILTLPDGSAREVARHRSVRLPDDERLGGWDDKARALGGWSLTPHHVYDPMERVLYRGDGRRVRVDSATQRIETRAGGGDWVPTVGGDAVGHYLEYATDVVATPDGGFYVADASRCMIHRVHPDGTLTHVAGVEYAYDFGGDGGPAVDALLSWPEKLALGPDGSLYITDQGNYVVRKIAPDGTISTVAGVPGSASFSGDGGPATSAELDFLLGIAVADDGTLYIADAGNNAIRRVDPDGIIQTIFAEIPTGGWSCPNPAWPICNPTDIALEVDGSLLIADSNHRVFRLLPDGTTEPVAGNGTYGIGGDGGRAVDAEVERIEGLTAGRDGTIYLADTSDRVRAIGQDGIIRTVAGTGNGGDTGDDGPAAGAELDTPYGVDVGPDGTLLIADALNGRVRAVSETLPRFDATEVVIPDRDGRTLFHFSAAGRHLFTRDLISDVTVWDFGYDAAGRLIRLTGPDGDHLVERAADGTPLALDHPSGERTTLVTDGAGYLRTVEGAYGATTTLVHQSDGLLTSRTDPDGAAHVFTYDAGGRLIGDDAPGPEDKTLTLLVDDPPALEVETTWASGEAARFTTAARPAGGRLRTRTFADGTVETTALLPDGAVVVTAPDGSVTTTRKGPDPLFGMAAPLTTELDVRRPSGAASTATVTRQLTFMDPADPATLDGFLETVTFAGETSTRFIDLLTGSTLTTTARGIETATVRDAAGRVIEVAASGYAPVQYAWNADGEVASVTRDDRVTTYTYDALGRQTAVENALLEVTGTQYGPAGFPLAQILPDGAVFAYERDVMGRVTAVTPADGPRWDLAYDAAGRLLSLSAPDVGAGVDVTDYTWDGSGRLASVSLPDGALLTHAYNAGGHLASVTGPSGTTAYTTAAGQLTQVATPDGVVVDVEYDGPRVVREAWSGPVVGDVALTLGPGFRPVSRTVNGGPPVPMTYDADGALASIGPLTLVREPSSPRVLEKHLGDVTLAYTYNVHGEVVAKTLTHLGAPLAQFDLVRDALGRVVQRTETVQGTTTTWTFTYDTRGRLTAATRDGLPALSLTYSPRSSWLSGEREGATFTATVDGRDRLLTMAGATFTYDARDRLVTETAGAATTTYLHGDFDRPRGVTLPDGRAVTYLLDGFGRRVGRRVDGVLTAGYLYDGQRRVAAELDGTGAVVREVFYADDQEAPALLVEGGGAYLVVTDSAGSVRLVVDGAGNIAQSIDYGPFGSVLSDTNPGRQPFGFAGGLHDPDTGLVHRGARDYAPHLGRFTARDPEGFAGGDLNLHSYARNDPIQLGDPRGTDVVVVQEGLHYAIYIQNPGRDGWVRAEFGPQTLIDMGLAATGLPVNGDVKITDPAWPYPPGFGDFRLPSTPAQDQAMLDAARLLDEADPMYQLLAKNCGDFVEEILAAGFDDPVCP